MSGEWYAVTETLEEVYHIYVAYLSYGVLKDTYYAVKPKHHQSYVVLYTTTFLFNLIFLGRNILSQVVPRKLIYLSDMLLHVCHLFSDVVLVVALLRCSPESLAVATDRTLWGGRCHVGSMAMALVSIVYQLTTLAYAMLRSSSGTVPLPSGLQSGVHHRPALRRHCARTTAMTDSTGRSRR
ncbi:uncharacterized protein LOC125942267 [Dermacentor silvarum]|uniref:uncharacterized protein LOC125942267 n=1 Tax=Dermacentor silvarum TaxID=543639 RepID=UPI00210156B9|nr:uncharacterized protein LOC125942267 [Dermacentor silvarum]